MRILLVRHGESLGNADPSVHATTADHAVPLSARGREQAREAGRRLAAFFERNTGGEPRHVRLWVSPYHRTRQTADALQETAGAWITDRVEHVLLCEQQYGLFDGVPEEELAERFPREFAHYDMQCRFGGKFWARMPQGESRFDVAQRIHQAFGTFQRDAQAHGIRDLVVICHGVTLRAFVMMWCHLSPEWFEHEPNPHNGAIRLIDSTGPSPAPRAEPVGSPPSRFASLIERGVDRGYVFDGFPKG